MKHRRLTIWTTAHLTVDFGCFLVLFGGLKPAYADSMADGGLETVTIGFLLYNILAFGLQALVGQLCDELAVWRTHAGRWGMFAVAVALGLVLIDLKSGPGTSPWMAWPAMVIAALGNAAFHVGAGRDVLVHSEGRMNDNGIFVSSGALGVGLGSLLGGGLGVSELGWVIVATVLILCFLSGCTKYWKICWRGEPQIDSCQPFHIVKERSFLMTAGLLFFVVVLRAFAGANISLSWQRTGLLVLLPSAASCLGKAAGGIVGDYFGAGRTGVGSLLISMPLILFGAESPLLSL
ncbi:MAG: hypothetical protein IJ443_08555, partial [Firmicutes bacterium]|nr:hypothetical protein [Bacillota bacterium]